jgi:outer membrane murein-binding lipoprotein Lpp
MAAVELEKVVEDRVGKLESDVQHLQADVTEIKADARQFRSEVLARFEKVDARFERIEQAIAELRTQMVRGDLQTRIWMLLSNGTVLAVMAHGFKWI